MIEVWQRWEGQVLDVTFPLLKYLGGCGRSAVFLTECNEVEPRKAVVKFVLSDPDAVRQQLSTLESSAKLNHPSLIRFFQWGLCKRDNLSLLYLVMEYAPEVLSEVLQQRSLTSSEMRELLVPTLSALSFLHEAGFVHGHLKPANILAVEDQLKVSGDGLIRIGEVGSGGWTPSVYAPPEIGRQGLSPAADIWALAMIMVEGLTGELPAWEGPERTLVLPETLPAPFSEIARNCLQQDPHRRWTTRQIAERLKPQLFASAGPSSTGAEFKRQHVLLWAVPVIALVVLALSSRLLHRDVNSPPAVSTTMAKDTVDRGNEPVPQDRYADDVGRFLAGLPAKPGSPLADLQKTNAWTQHRRELDRVWERFEGIQLAGMRAFQKQELSQPAMVRRPVFYPFSGPDTLMVTTFFPHNPLYVMVGLEPPGTLPAAKQLGRTDLERYLAKLRSTITPELDRSFFVTRQMDRQFRGQVTDGLFLPIVQLLVRTNHSVRGFRYVRLDDAGRIVARAADQLTRGASGVEIDFQTEGDGSIHKLFYFSANLSNNALQDNKPLLAFLSGLNRTDTFLKATSYMLHRPEFSIIDDLLLSKSTAILQDDSGIPYRYFLRPTWEVRLYGEYIRPYGSFRWLEQADLRKAYLTSRPKTLGFRIGYGYGRIPSHLLLAIKAGTER